MCPKRFWFNYEERIRSLDMSSALFLGSYIGEAVQLLALRKKKHLTDQEKKDIKLNPYSYFTRQMRIVKINDVEHNIMVSPNINYYLGDYDVDILTKADKKLIEKYKEEYGLEEFTFEDLREKYKTKSLPKTLKMFMNFNFWVASRRRGLMMIRAYEKEILPNIVEVHSIEKYIEIEEADGDDKIIGYIDMICDYKDEDGNVKKYVLDHKTASTRYQKNKLSESQQLHLYSTATGINNIGYLILIKKLKKPLRGKRKGEMYIDVQVMLGETDETFRDSVLEHAADTLLNIEDERFPMNYDGCWKFAAKCPYYSLCREKGKGLAESRLIKMPEREKK